MPIQPASHLTPPPIEWLWPGYLAAGSIAVLDGDPGLGKSLLTLDLAARLSTGRPWPDGAASPSPGPALLLCAEDIDSVIVARLKSLGADLDRAYVWPRLGAGLPRLPSELDRLDEALGDSAAKLVIIDPVVAFLDRSVTMNSDAAVRRALQPLASLAEKRRCAVVLVRHLNKAGGPHALYRGGGSIGFVAACRLAWLVGRDPRTDDRLILAQSKNNYAPRQPSLAYTVTAASPSREEPVSAPVPACGEPVAAGLLTCGGIGTAIRPPCEEPDRQGNKLAATPPPRLEWHGATPWTADELAARRPRPSRRRAREFLRAFLEPAPRPSRDIWAASREHSFSRNTLQRAKTELNIRSEHILSGGRRIDYWLLPGQQVPAGISDTPELDAWFRRLDEQNAALGPRNELT